MITTYTYDEIFTDLPDGSALMTIPEDVCGKIGLNPGDTVILTVDNDKLYIKKQNGKE